MSVPAAIATVAAINPMDILMASVNNNPYLIGIMMLLLNLGGRFLALEISKDQEKFLSQPMVRRFFLFAVIFVATRNVVIAAGLAILVILFLGYLFNENSDLCLWKSCLVVPTADVKGVEGFMGLTPEESLILKRLQDKQMVAMNSQKQKEGGGEEEKEPEITASGLYQSAINQLQRLF